MLKRLPGTTPGEISPKRPVLLLWGASGVGKTWFALDFPRVYYIDAEDGATQPHYQERMKKDGTCYFSADDGANHLETVLGVMDWLRKNKHQYLTLVIDSVTKLYTSAVDAKQAEFHDDEKKCAFGRDSKKAKRVLGRILTASRQMNMNVVLIAHKTKVFESGESAGATFKLPEEFEYELDLIAEAMLHGPSRVMRITKSRLLELPTGSILPLTVDELRQRLPGIVDAKRSPVNRADADLVEKVKQAVAAAKVDDETIAFWCNKAAVDTLDEIPADSLRKCLDWIARQSQAAAATPAMDELANHLLPNKQEK